MRLLELVAALAVGTGALTADGRMAVQLCGCDAASSASQQWTWEGTGGSSVASPATAPAPLRLKAHPDLCLFKGWGKKPTYLFVDACTAAPPPQLSFRSQHKPGMQRDLSVLTDGKLCMDADGMSSNLQLYNCIASDDDQQYAGIEGYGLVIDLWTGYEK